MRRLPQTSTNHPMPLRHVRVAEIPPHEYFSCTCLTPGNDLTPPASTHSSQSDYHYAPWHSGITWHVKNIPVLETSMDR